MPTFARRCPPPAASPPRCVQRAWRLRKCGTALIHPATFSCSRLELECKHSRRSVRVVGARVRLDPGNTLPRRALMKPRGWHVTFITLRPYLPRALANRALGTESLSKMWLQLSCCGIHASLRCTYSLHCKNTVRGNVSARALKPGKTLVWNRAGWDAGGGTKPLPQAQGLQLPSVTCPCFYRAHNLFACFRDLLAGPS